MAPNQRITDIGVGRIGRAARRIGLDVALVVFGLVVGLAIRAGLTQVYVGGSVGKTWQYGIGDDKIDRSACDCYTKNRESPSGALFAGYRLGYVGAEVGAGKLFKTHFHADCPSSSGEQTIWSSYRYARLNGYMPVAGVEVVPFLGRAFTKHVNYEVANTPDYNATNYTTGRTSGWLYGIGLQKNFDSWFARLEYQHVDHVAEDYWTARGFSNSTKTVSIGIGRYF